MVARVDNPSSGGAPTRVVMEMARIMAIKVRGSRLFFVGNPSFVRG